MGGCQSTGLALIQASGAGDSDLVTKVLERNPQYAAFKTLRSRNTPMLAAAARGHRDVLRLLYLAVVSSCGPARAQSCVDKQNAKGYTPFLAACRNGHADCVRYLVHCGANPLRQEPVKGQTCLHLAAEGSHNRCIVKLISSGEVNSLKVKQGSRSVKFVDCVDYSGMSPLHIAVASGCISTVWCLLRWGASLSTRVEESKSPSMFPPGSTVLHIAALSGNTSMLKWLLDYQEMHCPGLDLRQAENSDNMTPSACVESDRSLDRMLLDPTLPYSTLNSLWSSRRIVLHKERWRKEADFALQRVQLLLQSCILAMDRQMYGKTTKIECELRKLALQVTEMRSALSSFDVSGGDSQHGRSLTSRTCTSLGTFEALINLTSNLAKKVLKSSMIKIAEEDISVLQSMTTSLHTRLLNGKSQKTETHKRNSPTSVTACSVVSPSMGCSFSSGVIGLEHEFSRPHLRNSNQTDLFKNQNELIISGTHFCVQTDHKHMACDDQSSARDSTLTKNQCAICMDREEDISITGCGHRMCLTCAVEIYSQYKLQNSAFAVCPFCRQVIAGIEPLRVSSAKHESPVGGNSLHPFIRRPL